LPDFKRNQPLIRLINLAGESHSWTAPKAFPRPEDRALRTLDVTRPLRAFEKVQRARIAEKGGRQSMKDANLPSETGCSTYPRINGAIPIPSECLLLLEAGREVDRSCNVSKYFFSRSASPSNAETEIGIFLYILPRDFRAVTVMTSWAQFRFFLSGESCAQRLPESRTANAACNSSSELTWT